MFKNHVSSMNYLPLTRQIYLYYVMLKTKYINYLTYIIY
jgi:hypothetical protein